MRKAKKAQLASLQNLIVSLVVIGFILIVGLIMVGKTRDTQIDASYHCGLNSTNGTSGTLLYGGCSEAYQAGNATINAIDDIPDWLPVIVIAVVGVVILGIVFLFRRFSGG